MNTHSVYFYEDDTFLIDNVADFAKKGLEQQETVIIVATEQHRGDLKAKLTDEVGGLWGLTRQNYVTLDASATLALFMQNGWPDERLFLQVIGRIIESAASNTPVRIYGEMVAVLWAEGNTLAAIHLERLWNKLGKLRDFSLLCGYPASGFDGSDNDFALQEVCACHSTVVGCRHT
ncbi:MAG TPA: MEDS domain-containing protein [Nitrospiraceae bacterium]|nr:MEDS domain-containing protein [Nitrospiraceae bacterium]